LGCEVVYSANISVRSTNNKQMIDITAKVAGVLADSGVAEGLALVFTVHTTTGLYINEHEGGLVDDVESVLAGLVPSRGDYKHDRVDDNAASHIQSILLSPSLVVPVEGGRLSLGTWQAVFMAERDGPRSRTIKVKILGE
jgi:secondary thiamine-phosphate synthase enzyme